MPRWPLGTGETGGMLGDSAAVLFADGVVKGIQPVDYAAAYDILKAEANGPVAKGGRDQIADYVQRGWIPVESASSSAAMTIEYAYA
jgi:putative alpha-1,2-mannosidase